jgi:hypothetical protein
MAKQTDKMILKIPVASSMDKDIHPQLQRGVPIGMMVVDCRMEDYPDGLWRWTLVLGPAPKRKGRAQQ